MGAPSETYVDPSIDADSGAGTIGDPYGDLQHALDSMTRDSTNGDRINIKAGTDEVLTAAIDLTTYGTPTFDTPLIFEGYTSAAGDGGIGGIDGNAGNFSVFSGSAVGVHFLRIHAHNTGTAMIISMTGNYSSVTECEIDNSTGGGLSVGGNRTRVAYNHVHNCSGTGIEADNAPVVQNYLKNGTNKFTNAILCTGNSHAHVRGNIISVDGASNGIGTSTQFGIIIDGNSILSDGGTGTAIKVAANDKLNMVLINNLFEGFSGSGGKGIHLPSGTRHVHTYGHNAGFNCATNYDVDEDEILNNLGDNESLAASPFAKSGSDTFANRGVYFAPQDTGNVLAT